MRCLTRLLPAAGLLACIAVAAASAKAGETVIVQAQISYAAPTDGVRLVVERGSRRVLDARVPPYSGRFRQVAPVERRGRKPLTLVDLDGDGEPEILLDLFWGGAHCCFWSRIYRWDDSHRTYRSFHHLWGNVLYRAEDIDDDGRRELIAGDDRFASEFASFAESARPIRIWSYRSTGLRDATRSYPTRIARDAGEHWRRYRGADGKAAIRSALAAWAADECLLGRGEQALARLRSLADALAAPGEPALGYLLHLRAFLRRTGYLR